MSDWMLVIVYWYLEYKSIMNWMLFVWLSVENVSQMSNTGWDTGVSIAVCQTRFVLIKYMAVFECKKIGRGEHG